MRLSCSRSFVSQTRGMEQSTELHFSPCGAQRHLTAAKRRRGPTCRSAQRTQTLVPQLMMDAFLGMQPWIWLWRCIIKEIWSKGIGDCVNGWLWWRQHLQFQTLADGAHSFHILPPYIFLSLSFLGYALDAVCHPDLCWFQTNSDMSTKSLFFFFSFFFSFSLSFGHMPPIAFIRRVLSKQESKRLSIVEIENEDGGRRDEAQ